jgi:transposase, IS30 family
MGARLSTREERRQFWVAYLAGSTIREAAARVGRAESAGRSWLLNAGGMRPDVLEPPVGSRSLTIAEREEILIGVERDESIRSIAGRIGRAPSTVQRELRRNMSGAYRTRAVLMRGADRPGGPRMPGRPRVHGWDYRPHHAQLRAERKAIRPKPRKLVGNDLLAAEVQTRLERHDSPEQIAKRLKIDFKDDQTMQVSHETIYRSLFVQGRGGLRRDLTTRLRTGRAIRKPHRAPTGGRRGRIPGMVNIAERPQAVEDRAVPGHWEGDLIMGSVASNSAIGTLVERATRYVMLLHLPHGHGADAVQEAMVEAMSRLPDTLRRTLTWDQGTEMTNHAAIAAATDLDIYFCDPHSPWQRGSNENTNGLLRQYFPKGADLSLFAADYLDHVARQLNTRPRKTLQWATPAEKLDQLLSEPHSPPGVALTG